MPVVESAVAKGRRANDSMWRWLLAGAVALFAYGLAASAQAQCGVPTSSCRDCHESRAAGLFVAAERWHADHALGDFCSNCHGGSPTTADEGAHAGLADPLANEGERCRICHANRPRIFDSYLALARPPRAPGSAAGSPVLAYDPRPIACASTHLAGTQPNSGRSRNAICLAAIVVIGLLAAAYIAACERGAGVLQSRLRAVFRRSEWSAYACGALLGVVVTVSMTVFGRRLSGSGAYQELAGPLARGLSPSSTYWTQVIRPSEHWNSVVLAGAVAGSAMAAILGGRFRIRWLPDSQWTDVFGASIARRWSLAGLGAALTAVGGGIAGGCTASLALSGGAALSPGAFAFMAGMFAAGIPTARLLYGKYSR